MSKISKLTLKQFMLRQEIIKLYRDIHRTIRRVPDENSRNELRHWARSDFKANKEQTDEQAVKSLIQIANRSLKELKQSLDMSGR